MGQYIGGGLIVARNNQQKWKFEFFEKNLPSELQMKARELLDDNFNQLTIEQLIAEREKLCSNPFGCLLAIEVEDVIGVLILFKRQIYYHSEPIILGGLGRLCVVQEKRKKEAGYILLKIGMEELKKHDCDVAYLCTDSNSALVELCKKFEFVPLQKSYTFLGQSGKKYVGDDGMIAPLNSQEKFNLILQTSKTLHIGKGNW